MQKTGRGVKAVIIKEGKILVLKEPNGRYDLPGGRVEDGEGFEEALHREIIEETNVKAAISGPKVEWSFRKDRFLRIAGITFYCQYLSGKVHLSDEHTDHSWVGIDEIGQIDWARPYFGTENNALARLTELRERSCS